MSMASRKAFKNMHNLKLIFRLQKEKRKVLQDTQL